MLQTSSSSPNASSSVARLAFLATLVLSGTSCDLLTDPADSRSGARLLERSVGRPAWAADGGVIYYVSRAGPRVTTFTINAMDVASGRSSTLGSVVGWNTGGEQVRTTQDPSTVFFSIVNPVGSLQYSVYAVSSEGGPVETVVTKAGWPWFSISSSGNRLAYPGPHHGSDTLHVVTLADAEPIASLAMPTAGIRPNVLDISPDGATIVYGGPAAVYAVAATGGTPRVLFPASTASVDSAKIIAPQIVWNGADAHLLVGSSETTGDGHRVAVHDVSGRTGASTLLATIPDAIGAPRNLARSEDGGAWAAWVPVQVVDQNVERTTYRFRLYVQTAPDRPVEPVLEWTAAEPLYWLEFSPDRGRLGFVLGGALYVVGLEGA